MSPLDALRTRWLADEAVLRTRGAVAQADVLASCLADLTGLEAGPSVSVDLTVTQLAALFDKSDATVRAWVEAGDFPGAYKLNKRQWRIPASAVAAFQRAQAAPKDQPADLSAWRRQRKTG